MLTPLLFPILPILALLSSTTAAHIPSPYPSATALPTPTTAPQRRCASDDCSGAYTTALSASVVTSTILSVTSVPCYITTFVTNSQTVTSTIYNTETVTETQTKEGKVFIIQYEPKPILKSTVVQKVIPVTVDVESYWVESTGSAGRSTVREEWKTVGGGGGRPDCPTCVGGGNAPPPQQGGPAWTHAAAPTGASVGKPAGDGWAAAAGGGVAVGSGGTTWGNTGAHGQWQSAATPSRVVHGHLAMCVALVLGTILVGEVFHWL